LTKNQLAVGYDLAVLVFPGKDCYSERMRQITFLLGKSGLLSGKKC